MKKTIILLGTLLLTVLLNISVSAADATYRNTTIRVSGCVGAENANSPVLLLMLDKNADNVAFTQSQLYHIEYTEADSDGDYSFKFKTTHKGDYKIIINQNGENVTSSIKEAVEFDEVVIPRLRATNDGVQVELENLYDDDFSDYQMELCIAGYDKNNRFTGFNSKSLKNNGTEIISESIDNTFSADTLTLKAFLWDMSTLKPFTRSDIADMSDTTLWLMGDSIMANYSESMYPRSGWGMFIGDCFSDAVTIKNEAHSGWTTKEYLTSENGLSSFIDEIKPGDYVIIGLGVNDSAYLTLDEYEDNYRNIAQQVIAKGAEPIFTTPTIVVNSIEKRPDTKKYTKQIEIVKAVANDMNIICIDITDEMAKRINAEMKTDGKNMEAIRDKYYMWDIAENGWVYGSDVTATGRDGIHLNENGAKFVAQIVTDLLYDSDSLLGGYVNK